MHATKVHNSTIAFILAFCLMYSLYLYSFDSGASSGGVGLRVFLKLCVVIILFADGFRLKMEKYKLPLFFFMLFGLFSIILFLPFYSSRDLQWINQFMIFPLLFWRPKMPISKFKRLFAIIFYLWFVVDVIILYTDRSLWINEAFVGGVGNPSSFGLFSILAIAIGFYDRKYLLFILGIIGLLMSKALMPVLALIVSFLIVTRLRTKIILFSCAIIALAKLDDILNWLPAHLSFKIEGLISFISQGDYKNLASIGTRLEFLDSAKLSLGEWHTFLIGKYGQSYYYSGDSQWLTFLTSFGVPLTILFFIACVLVWRVVIVRAQSELIELFFLALFFLFITNRILDYWPVFIVVIYFINRIHFENSSS